MSSDCIFLSHISTGDNFTVYPIVCQLSEQYKTVHIFTLFRNRFTMKQMYENFSNILIHECSKEYNYCLAKKTDVFDLIQKLGSSVKVIVAGFYDFLGYNQKHHHMPFYREFYLQVEMNYDELRKKHNKIYRNLERETEFYEMVVKKYGTSYIFVHDHRHIDYNHYSPRKNVTVSTDLDIPIFHPNINYYSNDKNHKYYNLWSVDLIRENIFDYGMVIEKASEIYITDSSFCCLCCYLSIPEYTPKTIYVPSGVDIKDYYDIYKSNWKIYK
jgi:hypothetical protein